MSPRPVKKYTFHWEGERGGMTMCGLDSANEEVEFIFGDLYNVLVEKEIADDVDYLDICKDCDNTMEWEPVDDDSFS